MITPRLLYLVPDLYGPPGGIARYCRMVCQSLIEKNIPLTVIALNDQAQVDPGEILNPLRFSYFPSNASRSEFVQRAIQVTATFRPTMVLIGHAHFALLAGLLARSLNARLIAFIYGIEVWKTLSWAQRLVFRNADAIISISHFSAGKFARHNGIPVERVSILHNCLDPQFAHPLHPRSIGNRLSLLTVGRMSLVEQYKGHDLVIKAMPRLLTRFPDLIYHIVGDGDGRPSLEVLAAKAGVAHAVRFHGLVSEEALRRIYTEASVFMMPSRGEGFGFVYLEAMSYGIPAIGGNRDAAPESIVDGETGYIVDPTSQDAIVAAAERLLGDETLRQRMGQAAARHVAEKFNFHRFQERLLTLLFEKPLEQPGGTFQRVPEL